jgi:hypothetical protein
LNVTRDPKSHNERRQNSESDLLHDFELNPARAIRACYVPTTHPLNTGNPLIDALPAIRSDAEWIAQLANVPKFNPQEQKLESHLRSYKLSLLKRLFIPTAEHRRLARRIDQMIRWGYENRPPDSPERTALLQLAYERAQSAGAATKIVYAECQPICTSSLIGCSGMGKSTGVESILGSIPQCLYHQSHRMTQIVWLKVDCPRNGSVTDLARAILRAFDRVLGTDFVARIGSREGPDVLLAQAALYALANHLGILVLDEMQNLTVKKSGGREEMLNWFQSLVNEFKIPIFLMGTYKARSVLGLNMRHARRGAVVGSSTWDPLSNGPEFAYLVKKMWQYSWLRETGELTQEMLDSIHEETQGVRAFIIDMFLVAQLHALWKGAETITPELFRTVARTEFAPVQPMLNALRSKDLKRLQKFEDLVDFDLDSEIERLRQLIPAAGSSSPVVPYALMTGEAASNVQLALELSAVDAKQLVIRAVKDTHKSARALTEAALRLYMTEHPSPDESHDDATDPQEA